MKNRSLRLLETSDARQILIITVEKGSPADGTLEVGDVILGTVFFSKMTVASYGERERGHTGNYFSSLWGPLDANRAGPKATAAFLKEQRRGSR